MKRWRLGAPLSGIVKITFGYFLRFQGRIMEVRVYAYQGETKNPEMTLVAKKVLGRSYKRTNFRRFLRSKVALFFNQRFAQGGSIVGRTWCSNDEECPRGYKCSKRRCVEVEDSTDTMAGSGRISDLYQYQKCGRFRGKKCVWAYGDRYRMDCSAGYPFLTKNHPDCPSSNSVKPPRGADVCREVGKTLCFSGKYLYTCGNNFRWHGKSCESGCAKGKDGDSYCKTRKRQNGHTLKKGQAGLSLDLSLGAFLHYEFTNNVYYLGMAAQVRVNFKLPEDAGILAVQGRYSFWDIPEGGGIPNINTVMLGLAYDFNNKWFDLGVGYHHFSFKRMVNKMTVPLVRGDGAYIEGTFKLPLLYDSTKPGGWRLRMDVSAYLGVMNLGWNRKEEVVAFGGLSILLTLQLPRWLPL